MKKPSMKKAKPTDNADAYRSVLIHYYGKILRFKEILSCKVAAFSSLLFYQ